MVAASDAQMLKESDSLVLIRNLLRIGIFNISYIRGLFPEKYFNDKNVPALEMKIKKLMPMDAESKRLIDWMKKGVYDALQKNYLKTLMFCVCEALDGPMIEEYTFSFSYYSNSDTREVSMNFNRNGSKEQGEFKFATTEITTSQMKSSACKMVRTLIQLMGTLDKMPEERTILTKLLCYDDVMPADYEPPFFRGCTEDETLNTWTKIPLKVDNVNSKHFVLALKGVLDPCEDDSLSLGVDSMQPDGVSKSDSKVLSSGMGWAHMLPEILGVIREQLPFYEDYAAFAGVCKSWHSAAIQAAKGKLPPSRSPCLMRPEKIGADVFFEVFLLSDDSTHRIRPPEEHGRHGKDLRSSCGWLISLAGDHCLQMINPFSGIIFDLPKLDILGVYGHQFMGKVVFLAESSLVVAVLGEKLVFCRIGDDNWKTCTYNVFDSKIMDITCYNGRVYSLDCDHYIRSYDVCGDDANSRVDITRLAVDFDACEDVYLLADYIIGFDDGDKKCLLAIIREAEYFCDTDNYKTISFQVWCFDLGTRIWSRVQDLGSKSMFVGGISSSFLVEQDSTTGIKRNCIYFTSPDILFYKYGGLMDMGIYHLSDGTIESINTRGSSTYLTPSFWLQSDNSGTALQPKIASAAAENLKESEITEHDSLLITRNLLCMGISTISYIRGLFPEKYFNDKNVPALEMKIKKLMPMDAESKRLIDWMEKGVYDALQKKYLKTLMFCVCEALDGAMIEEYAFSFGNYSNSDSQEVSMNFNRIGCKKQGEFKFATTEITTSQMKSSACKMVRTLIQLMRTLDKMPEEATILMKLLYYDATPADYEPPFFRGCTEDETLSAWTKNPLKMEVGNVNSKHFVLALKVKSVLDPCEGDDLSLGGDLMQLDGDSESDSEPIASIESYAAAGNEKGRNGVNQDDKMVCSGLSKRPRKASTVKDPILLTPESQ